MDTSEDDWRPTAVLALSAALSDLEGPLRGLMAEAVEHLAQVLDTRPAEHVAAVAVPAAIFHCLSPDPVPHGLLAAAGATYLAFAVLDDQMDGEEPGFWRTRTPSEIVIGAQLLLLSASKAIGDGAAPAVASRMRSLYRAMIAAVAQGQLLTEQPLSEATTPASVAATIGQRSGAMLAGFAAMAAVAAQATEAETAAARTFGHELAVARQHLNDITELVSDRMADVQNQTATMAVAFALQPLRPAQRAHLVSTVQAAATDQMIRRRLVSQELASAIAEVAILVQLHLLRARMEARSLKRTGMGHNNLHSLIEFTSAALRRKSVS